jgi:hypothetical protein
MMHAKQLRLGILWTWCVLMAAIGGWIFLDLRLPGPRLSAVELILAPPPDPTQSTDFVMYLQLTRGHYNILVGPGYWYVYRAPRYMCSNLPGFPDAERESLPTLYPRSREEVFQEVRALLLDRPDAIVRIVMLPEGKYGDLVALLTLMRQAPARRWAVSKLLRSEARAVAGLGAWVAASE